MGLRLLEGGVLPPDAADRLTARLFGYYVNRFSTTEVNYSFYQVPSAETYGRWLNLVPPDFVFALKANRLITHVARLREG